MHARRRQGGTCHDQPSLTTFCFSQDVRVHNRKFRNLASEAGGSGGVITISNVWVSASVARQEPFCMAVASAGHCDQILTIWT
jgi:hypothetical protein